MACPRVGLGSGVFCWGRSISQGRKPSLAASPQQVAGTRQAGARLAFPWGNGRMGPAGSPGRGGDGTGQAGRRRPCVTAELAEPPARPRQAELRTQVSGPGAHPAHWSSWVRGGPSICACHEPHGGFEHLLDQGPTAPWPRRVGPAVSSSSDGEQTRVEEAAAWRSSAQNPAPLRPAAA